MPAVSQTQAHHKPRWVLGLRAVLGRDRTRRPRPPVTLAKLNTDTDQADPIGELIAHLRRQCSR